MTLAEARAVVTALLESSAVTSAGFRALDPETVSELGRLWDEWRSKPSWEKRGENAWYDAPAVRDALGLLPSDRVPRFVKRLKRRDLP